MTTTEPQAVYTGAVPAAHPAPVEAFPSRLVGVAGLAMVVGIMFLGPVLGAGPDPFASDAVTRYGEALSGSPYLDMAEVRFGFFCLLTAIEVLFFAGWWGLVRRKNPNSLALPVLALCAAGFIGGAIASDALTFGQVVALSGERGVSPDANLAVINDVSVMLAITEVQICLALAIGATSFVGLQSGALPRWLCFAGMIAALMAFVPGFAPGMFVLSLGSNLLRLLWILALSLVLVSGRLETSERRPR